MPLFHCHAHAYFTHQEINNWGEWLVQIALNVEQCGQIKFESWLKMKRFLERSDQDNCPESSLRHMMTVNLQILSMSFN